MAERRRGVIAGGVALGLGALAAGAVAAERAWIRRDRTRPDPYAAVPYGHRPGEDLPPITAFDGTVLAGMKAGSGPPVILAHGFSLASTLWYHQLVDLAADMRLVAYDHRGHGRSGMPANADISLEALARDLRSVIQSTADGPAVLVGHSMGGMAVLEFAARHADVLRDRVAGIVLADTTSADVMGGILPGIARRLEAALQGLQEASMRALARHPERMTRLRDAAPGLSYMGTRLMGFGPDPSPRQVDFVQELLASTPTEVWTKAIPAMVGLDVTDSLQHIAVPVLVVVGLSDRLTPPHAAERIAAGIPDAELVTIPGAGHTPMLERPDEFNDLLRRFVKRVTA